MTNLSLPATLEELTSPEFQRLLIEERLYNLGRPAIPPVKCPTYIKGLRVRKYVRVDTARIRRLLAAHTTLAAAAKNYPGATRTFYRAVRQLNLVQT